MKPKVQTLGGHVRTCTLIPSKIRRRSASEVVVRLDGLIESSGKVASQIDQPLAGGADSGPLLAATDRRLRGLPWQRDRPARRLASLDGQ